VARGEGVGEARHLGAQRGGIEARSLAGGDVGRPVELRPERAHRGHALRVRGGEVQGDVAAHAVAEEHRAGEAAVVHPRAHVRGERRDGEGPVVGERRGAVAGELARVHVGEPRVGQRGGERREGGGGASAP
jgi:hypothetical protein